MGIFSFLFKSSNNKKQELIEALNNKAVIVDVRTPGEYSDGHIKGSINVPLQHIANQAARFETKGKTIITCCRSGARSRQAADILKQKGVKTINGGAWLSLNRVVEENK